MKQLGVEVSLFLNEHLRNWDFTQKEFKPIEGLNNEEHPFALDPSRQNVCHTAPHRPFIPRHSSTPRPSSSKCSSKTSPGLLGCTSAGVRVLGSKGWCSHSSSTSHMLFKKLVAKRNVGRYTEIAVLTLRPYKPSGPQHQASPTPTTPTNLPTTSPRLAILCRCRSAPPPDVARSSTCAL